MKVVDVGVGKGGLTLGKAVYGLLEAVGGGLPSVMFHHDGGKSDQNDRVSF